METVSVNSFVTRQVRGSGKSYSIGLEFEEIAKHAAAQLNTGNFESGYRDGVRLVHVSNSLLQYFYSPLVKISEDMQLRAVITRRRVDEEPYIQLRAIGVSPVPAGSVNLILYRHDVLAETGEDETNADWELIAFNCLPEGLNQMPMGPVTMMRNQLQLTGGTKGEYTSKEWAESVRFWQNYAMCDDSAT